MRAGLKRFKHVCGDEVGFKLSGNSAYSQAYSPNVHLPSINDENKNFTVYFERNG